MSAKGYRWLLAQKDAEIKRLRAKVARVEALADLWRDEEMPSAATAEAGLRDALAGEQP